MKKIVVFAVLALMAAADRAIAERTPGLERDKFHIACFSFNPPAQKREHMRQARECGLDFVCGGIYVESCPEIRAFEEEGLDFSGIMLPRVCGGGKESDDLRRKYPRKHLEKMLDDFNARCSTPAVRLMNICDEPGVCSMEFLGEVVRLVDSKCPHTRAHVNLFPNYASVSENSASAKKSQLGTSSYKAYIEEYCRLVPTTFISFDHYPIFKTPERTREFAPRWYGNLKVVADACRRTGRDLWVGTQVNSRPKCPPLTENNLRYQAFSAMAFGAVELTWACWTLGWWDNNLMETNGTLTCQYPKLKKVNAEIRALADRYMEFRNVATHFIGFEGEKKALAKYEISPVGRLSASGVTDLAAEGSSLVVGEMAPRGEGDAARAFFVFGAGDCGDERRSSHKVTFGASGKVLAFSPAGAVPVEESAPGRFSFDIVDNAAVLVVVNRSM